MQLPDERRREDGGDEQQDVQPDAVAELAGRSPRIFGRTTDEFKWRTNSLWVYANGVQPIDYPMFWRSFPGLKRIVRPGGMRTSLPVRGFRPMPRLRGFTWNKPNPRSSMRSPRCIEIRIALKTASNATRGLTLVLLVILSSSF